MYIPSHFEELDSEKILRFIQDHGFATLISNVDGVPYATHLPLLATKKENHLVLQGHFARANPQWQNFGDTQQEALAIFHGPHAYISPNDYNSPGVPTWNYAVVHLYGNCRIVEDELNVRSIVDTLTHQYEATSDTPWFPQYPDAILNAIVGFEIQVCRVEAKFKLSQNRPEPDQIKIQDRLRHSQRDDDRKLAALMTPSP